jgi:hypothetical protein
MGVTPQRRSRGVTARELPDQIGRASWTWCSAFATSSSPLLLFRPARSAGRACGRRTGRACGGSLPGFAASGSRWRQRRRRAGGSWSRNCTRSAPTCISPSRRSPPLGGGERNAPRPIGRMARHARAVDGRPAAGVVDPAQQILDLRARVRLRHTLVDQRGEWQQRIHAVLYHSAPPNPHMGPARSINPSTTEARRCTRLAPESRRRSVVSWRPASAALVRLPAIGATARDRVATPAGAHPLAPALRAASLRG